ncbi:MAG: insulinase family protein [Burkholderiales bacterium]|nr:insulinase family protein [Burkholderiales bacterium]
MRFSLTPVCLAIGFCFAPPAFAETAAAPAATVAAEQPATAVKFTSIEGITEYRLANGLRVLLAPDASKPTTTVNVTYQVGSRMEKYGETGMAHLLEHLVFKGTPSLPGKTIVQEFAKRGMRFNGSTWFDRTNYFETFAASDDNLDWALKMEADRMVHSNIWRSDLDSEMTVVRNEMEMGENSPTRILWEKMAAAAYEWHSYGKDTIGARADVENVNIEHLQAFYRNFYQPDNAVLIVTGKFDEAKVLERIGQYFGSIPKPTRTLEPMWTVEPVQDGARSVALSRVGDTQLIGTLYHISAAASPDFPAMQALAQILGDTPNGRLYKALVEKKLAASVDAEPMGLHDPGYILFLSTLNKQQSRDKAGKALIDVLENIKKQPITEAELKRAKTQLLNDFEKTLNDPVQFGVRLSESIAVGDWRLFFLDRDRIEALTTADVERVAENYLKASNRTYGEFIPTDKPDRATMPAAVDVAALVKDYKGHEAVAAGENFDPSPANIEKRTTRTTLANGMRLIELPKKTRGNTVNGELTLHFGDEKTLAGKKQVAEATAAMLMRGAGKLDRKQIADKLEELKAKLNIHGGSDQVNISFETRRDRLPEFLALLHDVLRKPTFPATELDQFKNEWTTGIEEQRHQPDAVAQNTLSRYDNPYSKGDVRYAETFDEQIDGVKAVKLADIKAFHTRFYGTDHADFALVGDFDEAATSAQIKALFGDWKSGVGYTHVTEPYRATKSATQQLETPDKANAFYMASIAVPAKDTADDFAALALANRILGGGALKSRIIDRLRQKDGISYGAGSWLAPNPYEANSSIGMYAIYAPQNLDKLKSGMSEVLATILKDGITEQELAEAKSGMLQDATVARTQDGSLANQLANQAEIGRTMTYTAEKEAKIKAATVEQVNAALRKYVDLDHFVQIYAGDFAGAAKHAAADKTQ